MLVVEDDKKIASFVSAGLKQSGFAVDHSADGQEAYALASATPYDAAVVDVMLPGIDGISLVQSLRRDGVKFPIIFLSARGSVEDRIKGLQSGGDDYLTKPFSFAELLARLQAMLRRTTHAASEPTKLTAGDLSMDLLTREVIRNGQKLELQPREFALLEYLLRNQGKVITKAMILEHIFDYSFDPQTNVVDVLVHRLRGKVDKEFPKKLIQTYRGIGYALKP